MNYIIDRFEDGFAVCEDEKKEMTDIPRELLPPEAKAGDIIQEAGGAYSLDLAATEERRKAVYKKMMGLFE